MVVSYGSGIFFICRRLAVKLGNVTRLFTRMGANAPLLYSHIWANCLLPDIVTEQYYGKHILATGANGATNSVTAGTSHG